MGEDALSHLNPQKAHEYSGIDVSMLSFELDGESVHAMFEFTAKIFKDAKADGTLYGIGPYGGVSLRIAHSDISSGTEMEQRIYDLKKQRLLRDEELAHWTKMKKDSHS